MVTVSKSHINYKDLIITIKTLKQINREIYHKIDNLQEYIESLQSERKYLTDALCYHIIRQLNPIINNLSESTLTSLIKIEEGTKYDIEMYKEHDNSIVGETRIKEL